MDWSLKEVIRILQNMVGVGTISSIDYYKKTAKVDLNGRVTGDLYIVQTTPWFPSIGQNVLCLFMTVNNGDGFILGGL